MNDFNQQLAELNKSPAFVTLVRYFFGTQTDSVDGYMVLFKTPTSQGQTVHFNHEGLSFLFGVNDIKSIDTERRIIRLKSPSDYDK